MKDELDPYLDPQKNPFILTGDSKAPLPEETEAERQARILAEQKIYDDEAAVLDPEENPFIVADPPKTENQSGDGLAPFSTLDDLDEEKKATAEAAKAVEEKISEVFGDADALLLGKISFTRSDDHFLADGILISDLDERELSNIDALLDRQKS